MENVELSLIQLRMKAGLTRKQVAALADISVNQLFALEIQASFDRSMEKKVRKVLRPLATTISNEDAAKAAKDELEADILKDAEKLVSKLRAAGWTKERFAQELERMLNS